jgi:hypothetical protein
MAVMNFMLVPHFGLISGYGCDGNQDDGIKNRAGLAHCGKQLILKIKCRNFANWSKLPATPGLPKV